MELIEQVDREHQSFYQLKLVAVDAAAQSGSVFVDVTIDDINDNVPQFVNESYQVEVTENAPPDRHLAVVRAVDRDSGRNARVFYALTADTQHRHGHLFAVDRLTGVVSQLLPLDFEQTSSPIVLVISATDLSPNDISDGDGMTLTAAARSSTAHVVVTVHDINDNSPVITLESPDDGEDTQRPSSDGRHIIRVGEHGPGDEFLGLLTVDDADSGDAGNVDCSMISSHFQLTPVYEQTFKVN